MGILFEAIGRFVEWVMNRVLNTPGGKAAFLAFTQAYVWLWIQSFFQTGLTSDGHGDMGLATIIPGWFWALVWGGIVCRPISRKVLGKPSVAGFLTSALFILPETWLLYMLIGFPSIVLGHRIPDIGPFLNSVRSIVGLSLLPEGRKGFASFDTFMFLGMFMFGFGGFLKTGLGLRREAEDRIVQR